MSISSIYHHMCSFFVWATFLYLQFKFEGSRKVDLKILVKLTAVVFNLLRLFMLDMSTYVQFHQHFMRSYCADFFAHTPKVNQNFSCSFDFCAKKIAQKMLVKLPHNHKKDHKLNSAIYILHST